MSEEVLTGARHHPLDPCAHVYNTLDDCYLSGWLEAGP